MSRNAAQQDEGIGQLTGMIEMINGAFEDFKEKNNAKTADLEARADAMEKHVALVTDPFFGVKAGSGVSSSMNGYTIDGRKIPVLAKGDKLASLYPTPSENPWSIGDFVRGSLGLKVNASVVERGTATVPQYVSSDIIDLIRAKTRLVQAGSVTIPIEGKTHLCKITGDPTVYEHTEGVPDVQESLPTFSPVILDPKTLVALIPLSMEIVQDSPNLEVALNTSIAAAFASKIDTLGLATILADANIPTSASSEETDSWAGTLAAVGSMLAANMDIPKACICGTTDFITRAGQMASNGPWLGAPPVLTNMLDLPTTNMTDGFATLGDFSLGFGIAVRQELRLEVVRWAKSTSASHVLVAYMRAAGYVLQPGALYNQVDTVSE